MVTELKIGDPAICVQADKSGYFKEGDITFVNNLSTVPTSVEGDMMDFAMMMHPKGFIYVPASLFRPLTEEEAKAFEAYQTSVEEGLQGAATD